jgi:cobalt-zinc-cadmium efflux system protein
MSGNHDHGVSEVRFEKPLWWALALTATFLVAEVIGGLITNSLALLSDAAHMMTDVIALGISLFAVRMAKRPADSNNTYGYARMEALGALINGGLLFLVAGYILWEAVGRFRQPPEVASTGMFVVAVIGLIVNLISMRLLKAGSGDSLNVKGAYLEVWSDMLGSVGVILGAVVIRFTGWTLIDPIIAVAIGLWVLPRTWTLLRAASHVLMQGAPSEIAVEDVRAALMRNRSVGQVHDLHVWSVSSQRAVLTAHVVLRDQSGPVDEVRRELSAMLDELFGINEVTLQIEQASYADEEHGHGHS